MAQINSKLPMEQPNPKAVGEVKDRFWFTDGLIALILVHVGLLGAIVYITYLAGGASWMIVLLGWPFLLIFQIILMIDGTILLYKMRHFKQRWTRRLFTILALLLIAITFCCLLLLAINILS